MKSIQTRSASALIVAIGLAAAALVYAYAQSSIGGPAEALGAQVEVRSSRASEVEAQLADSNLAARLESGLAKTFGGVWFEPATAQLDVAVTSPAGASRAAAIAADAGMAGEVVAIPVQSSWAQLKAAQARWSRHLAGLFERAEVATWLAPETNSVGVQLASSVPASRRASLERAAAANGIPVSVSVSPQAHLEVIPQSRCAAFAKDNAFCDPTIVAGQTLRGPSVNKSEVEEAEGEEEPEFEELEGGKERKQCTAGPAVLPVNRTKPADATKTYILTAGHCINEKKGGGGVGGKWEAYDKNGNPKGGHEVGAAVTYLDNITDVGVIEVNTTAWAKAKDVIPVVPTVAPWNQAAPEPVPVIQQLAPVLNAESCMAGQTSGLKCGKIVTLDQEIQVRGGVKIKNLIEVSGITGQGGDSGAPYFSKAKFEEKVPTAYVEGTHVGTKVKTGGAVFQSLATSFAELNALKGLNLELLTQANEKRHPEVKAGSYPVTIHGSTSAAQKFTTEAGVIECKSSTYHALVSEAEKETSALTVKPEYKECKLAGVAMTIAMEECAFVLHLDEKTSTDNYHAYMDVSCPTGKSIKITGATCKAEVKSQAERETVDLVDDTTASPKKDITLRPTLTGLTYTVTEDGASCPFKGTGEKTTGEYTSAEGVTLTGQSPTESATKIAIEVAGP